MGTGHVLGKQRLPEQVRVAHVVCIRGRGVLGKQVTTHAITARNSIMRDRYVL
jgi:hypothetical protein